jgi:hypothetical protein
MQESLSFSRFKLFLFVVQKFCHSQHCHGGKCQTFDRQLPVATISEFSFSFSMSEKQSLLLIEFYTLLEKLKNEIKKYPSLSKAANFTTPEQVKLF